MAASYASGRLAQCPKRRGFTLVELLVVMGIIVMLMALLLPAVNSARETARQGVCANNMKNLAMGVYQYALKKERYPGWRVNVGSEPVGWVPQIFPYIDQSSKWDDLRTGNVGTYKEALPLLWCPSDPPTNLNADPLKAPYPLSYAVNGGQSGEQSNDVFRDHTINNPVKVSMDDISGNGGLTGRLIVTENVNLDQWTETTNEYNQAVLYDSGVELGNPETLDDNLSNSTARPSSYHRMGVNVGYGDGSVKFFVTDPEYYTESREIYQRMMLGTP